MNARWAPRTAAGTLWAGELEKKITPVGHPPSPPPAVAIATPPSSPVRFRRPWWRRAVCGWLALCLAPPLAAQMPDPPAASLSLERYGLDEGLSQLSVTALQADDQGFLWVATQDGLNRFDGHGFRTYRAEGLSRARRPSLASGSIDSLAFEAQRQRLWLGTNDAGVDVVHLPTWTRRQLGVDDGLSHLRVTQILLDPGEDGAWVGTERGVDRIAADIGSARTLGATAEIVGLAWSPPLSGPVALDARCGLWRVDEHALQGLPSPAPDGRCVGLQAGADDLWLMTVGNGLFRLDPTGHVLQHWPADAFGAGADPSALLRLDNGDVLIGFTDGGVSLLEAGRDTVRALRFDRPPGSAITQLHQSSTGAWWIGTYTSGLYRVRPLASVILHDDVDLGDMRDWASQSIRAIRRDGARMFIGTDSGLGLRDEREAWRFVPALARMSVRTVVPARQGGWWIGTQSGLWRLHEDDRVERIDVLPDPRVDALLPDDDGLWVGTRGGPVRLEDGRIVDDPRLAPLDGDMVTTFHRDPDGTLWIATNARGLWRLTEDALTRVEPAGAGLHASLWALHGDADALWVGSFAAGLFRIDRATGASTVITDRDGLGNNVIYRILPDGGGRLWLSTNLGLSVYDPASGTIQTLGRRDGLRSQEYNSGAAFAGRDGRLYFGGTLGLDVIAPAQLPLRSPPARPVLTDMQLLGYDDTQPRRSSDTDIVYATDITLDSEDSVFSIGMTAIDFLAPAAARLRYRVHGLHESWIEPQQARAELSMNHLPAGRYRLEVQAAGRDGRFGASRTLDIHIPPPPWRHPLAYAAYALLAVLLVAGLMARSRRAIRREREHVELLNRTVAQRTAQLEHANQQLQLSNAQLDAATRIDPLTQLANRRALQDWIAQTPASATSTPLYFFMIDIDAFKRINDGHGHQAGDEVLVQFAGRMRALCHERDLLVRWGGEEFMLVARLPGGDAAAALAERMRAAIAGTPVPLSHGAVLTLTCSIGFAPWPLSPAWPALGDWQQSSAIADRCLYAAKAAGRNAWIGVVPGTTADRQQLQTLLAGANPFSLGDAVRVLHSTREPPSFER